MSSNCADDIESAVPESAGPTPPGEAFQQRPSVSEDAAPKANSSTINKVVAPLGLAIGVAALVVGSIALSKANDPSPPTPMSAANTDSSALASTMDQSTTLEDIQQRGVLNCGVVLAPGYVEQPTPDTYAGFDVDLCRAVAAGIFGVTKDRDEYIDYNIMTYAERWQMLQSKTVDLLAASTTHTMERDVYIPEVQTGFSFSVPYVYAYDAFAGLPDMVTCADNMNVTDACASLKVRTALMFSTRMCQF